MKLGHGWVITSHYFNINIIDNPCPYVFTASTSTQGFNASYTVYQCPDDCVGVNHACVDGKCVCAPGYSGIDCSIELCPANCSTHLGQGTCDQVSSSVHYDTFLQIGIFKFWTITSAKYAGIPCLKLPVQSSAVITRFNIVRYYINEYRNWSRIWIRRWIHKDTPYLALTGEIWGVFCGYLWENWPRYNGTALYWDCIHLTEFIIWTFIFLPKAQWCSRLAGWPSMCKGYRFHYMRGLGSNPLLRMKPNISALWVVSCCQQNIVFRISVFWLTKTL